MRLIIGNKSNVLYSIFLIIQASANTKFHVQYDVARTDHPVQTHDVEGTVQPAFNRGS